VREAARDCFSGIHPHTPARRRSLEFRGKQRKVRASERDDIDLATAGRAEQPLYRLCDRRNVRLFAA
jgi:hypothetical protein